MDSELKRANDAGRERLATTPRAVAAGFSEPYKRLLIELSDGLGLLVDPGQVQGLQGASADDLNRVEITPSGFGLHFPTLDADVYLPGLLEGRLGSARFMAAELASRGGSVRSDAKAAAARANGRLGGRPRKATASA